MPRPTYIHRQTLRTQDPSPEKCETQKSLKHFKLKYTLKKKKKLINYIADICACKGLKGLKVINTDHRNLMEAAQTAPTQG